MYTDLANPEYTVMYSVFIRFWPTIHKRDSVQVDSLVWEVICGEVGWCRS